MRRGLPGGGPLFYAKECLLQVNDMSCKFIFAKERESFYLNIEPVA